MGVGFEIFSAHPVNIWWLGFFFFKEVTDLQGDFKFYQYEQSENKVGLP
jgi:hypothetical protein